MSGAVCFRDTRVPVSILADYIAANEISLFRGDFPDVTEDQVLAVIQQQKLKVNPAQEI